MNARIRPRLPECLNGVPCRPSRILSVALLSATLAAASVVEARAACTVPGPSKLSALTGANKLARPGIAPALAAAAQSGNSNGGGPIVGQWQVVMTASPGTPGEFIFDFGFQQFHSDGTELMISGGVPPTIGNVCIGVWERQAGGAIHLRHMTWNWAGNEVLGDPPTGYFLLEVTVRTNSQGTAYSGTWKTASFDLGAGPLGSGGPAQPGTEFEGTIQAVKIAVQ
jgi:hypothetical protein